jgi:hypothetical protein
LLIGPVFTREVVTAPRRSRLYVSRAAYVAGLLVLMCTAWLLLAGTQVVRNVGDMARFGAMLFQILAPLQLALAIFFSALLAASAVTQEKDRRTLVLLLLTNLSNSELVLGKLLASLLGGLVLLAAALPLFMLSVLFGGVSFEQIARAFGVTLATAVVAGSIGSLLALWREKTRAGVLVGVRRGGVARRTGRFVAGCFDGSLGGGLESLAGDPVGHTAASGRAKRPALGRQCDQRVSTAGGDAHARAQCDRHSDGASLESLT